MSIPLLFTLPPSNRHEFIVLDTSSEKKLSLKQLNKLISDTISASPNCEEFMSKHKSSATKETIQEMKFHWDTKGRDAKMWPEYTVVTEANLGAILEVVKSVGFGVGVLEVRVGKEE